MFNLSNTNQTTDALPPSNSVIQTGAISNMACNGLTTSDQDLRKTKNELFNKLIERQPQQSSIVTTPNKTISDENISNLKRSSNNNTDSRNRFAYQKATSSDLAGSFLDHRHVIPSAMNDLEMSSRLEEPILFSKMRSRWYTNDEVASILTNFSSHPEWQTNELQVRPQSGAVLLYSREKVRYRQDGYCWKKRKNGRTTREDHMKLKVQGIECIYGCYVHSALLPTFHRRCYWLLENPDIVLVHYLNQPPDDKSKMMVTFDSSVIEADTRRRWTNEEIIEEIGSVFGGISQIHHTLSINLPTGLDNCTYPGQTISPAQMSSISISGETDSTSIQQPLHDDNPPPDTNCDIRGLITSQGELLVMLPEDGMQSSTIIEQSSMNYTMHEDKPNIIFDVINNNVNNNNNNNNSNSNNNNTILDGNRVQGDSEDNDADMIAMNHQDMGESDNYSQNAAQQQNDFNAAYNVSGVNQTASDSGAGNGVQIKLEFGQGGLDTLQQAGCNHLNSSNKSDHEQLKSNRDAAGLPPQETAQNPCSPVTQIYNKIVDDIETYVLPLEMNQFESGHHHHHHNHSRDSPSADQLMDTGEPDQRQHKQVYHQSSLGQHQSNVTDHEIDLKSTEQTDMNQVELLSCDLFANCSNFGDESLARSDENQRQQEQQHPSNDMLLTDFNLTGSDSVGPNQVMNDELGSSSMANVDDLRDLMIGISSTNEASETTVANQESSGQLSHGCETTDTLELFDFRHLNCEHEYRNQLDVKSTTSDTDTLNRLSPIIPMVPRCNSTDNAMQATSSSIQRLSAQYQHHASSQFLSNTTSSSLVQNEHLIQTFAEYDTAHHHKAAIGTGVHRSATNTTTSSTEQSNSTSCSASPSTSSLLNASTSGRTSHSGASYMNNNGGGGGGNDGGGMPTAYHESSTKSSSFIKVPLQQRQNSEQREPSNSVLSSLLPKALSLDGSDLSSSTSYRRLHHGNHNHHNHIQHHQNNQQSQQHHQNRTSPLINSYHRGGSSSRHSSASTYGAASLSQASNNMLLIPPSSGSGQQAAAADTGRHYYQRPSAPSLSPSLGNYSLDSSSSSGCGRIFVDGSQYRSSSVVAATLATLNHQQQQQAFVDSCKLRAPLASHARLLPILDYVPNWSRSLGGIKVLLVGNWAGLLSELPKASGGDSIEQSSSSSPNRPRQSDEFSVLFDDLVVPASLIQDNVLRCYSPAREPGFIALKVLYKNLIVSEQVLFEIRAEEPEASVGTSPTVAATTTTAIPTTTTAANMN